MRPLPLHPLLVAAFPVLYLWAQNAAEAHPAEVLPVLAAAVVVGAVAGLLLGLLLRDVRRGALVASAAAFLLLAHGRLWAAAVPAGLALAGTVVAVVAVGVVVRRVPVDRVRSWTGTANVVGVVLVVAGLVPVVAEAATASPAPDAPVTEAPGARPPDEPRDIYYVVLDRYPRADTLAEVFGVDNDPFLSALEARGFDVAEASVANYPKTAHSLAASLNLTYLDQLEATVPSRDQDRWAPVYELLRDHALGRILTGLGYRYVHLGTWWSPTQTAASADVTLNHDRASEFGRVFLETTAWSAVQRLGSDGPVDTRTWKRDHTLYQLAQLERLAAEPAGDRPRFVFAHLTVPHEPYVFEADGGFVTREQERRRGRDENFRRQLAYTNTRVLDWLDGLVTGDDATDPIVVVQADEGPHPIPRVRTGPAYRWTSAPVPVLREKLRILTATRFPGVADEEVPETVTPVNLFRFVLSRYAGADLPPLPDEAYVFPDEGLLYRFTRVTDLVR